MSLQRADASRCGLYLPCRNTGSAPSSFGSFENASLILCRSSDCSTRRKSVHDDSRCHHAANIKSQHTADREVMRWSYHLDSTLRIGAAKCVTPTRTISIAANHQPFKGETRFRQMFSFSTSFSVSCNAGTHGPASVTSRHRYVNPHAKIVPSRNKAGRAGETPLSGYSMR